VVAWDLRDRKELMLLSGNACLPYALTTTGDGRTVAAAGADGVVRQWKLGGKLEEAAPVKWGGPIHALAYAPDGQAVLMGRSDGSLLVHRFDPAGDFPLGSEIEAGQIAVAADGRTILVGEGVPGRPLRQGRVRVWDVPSGHARPPLLGPGPAPSALAMSWDGRLAAAADQGGNLHVWEWPSMKERAPFEAVPERRILRGLAFSPDGRALVALENTGKEPAGLQKWDASTGRLSADFRAPLEPEGYFSLAYTSDSRLLAVGHLQQGVKVLDAATGKEVASIPVSPIYRRQSLVFAEDGRTLAIGTGGSSLKFWDPRDKKELPPLRGSATSNAVCGLAFTHEPGLVAATPDGQIIHWPLLPGD
jgi:WD40 repeat protein